METEVTASQVLFQLKKGLINSIIDVRSEDEFTEGHLPYSINLPILKNSERHDVGLEYKLRGQSAAIELGHKLVLPFKHQRVLQWQQAATPSSFVACWRGGLRSKITTQWLQEAGLHLPRVRGGYKAIRRELLRRVENPPDLIVLCGWTGSGKTKLLKNLSCPKLDLEYFAHHRGSCFGQVLTNSGKILEQPSQSSFENAIGLELWGSDGPFVVEDESTRIGSLNVPKPLKDKMKTSSIVFVEASPLERTKNIYHEYIANPLSSGVGKDVVGQFFLDRLNFLKRSLGGLEYTRFFTEIQNAFQTNEEEAHLEWIKRLLTQHYDPSYRFAFERLERKVLFRGSASECLSYLNETIPSRRFELAT